MTGTGNCKYEKCEEETPMEWVAYCYKHAPIMKQKEEEYKKQKELEQKQQAKPEVTKPEVQPQVYARENPVVAKPGVIKPLPKFEIPKLGDRERTIIKQSSIKIARDILLNTGEIDTMTYDQVLQRLRRLTVDIYKIVVEKNESH